jgi:predicted RNase H-like HicB family nuclease
MTHYVAIVEEEPGKAVGVWFPDLPGCFSAGDTVEEAMLNARNAIALWADAHTRLARPIPPPRTVAELKADPEAAPDLDRYLLALIPLEGVLAAAAE